MSMLRSAEGNGRQAREHADASLPASPSLHAVSMPASHPAWASSQNGGSHSAHTTPLCCTMEPRHYPGVSLSWRGTAGDYLGSATTCHCCVQSALMGESKWCGSMAWQHYAAKHPHQSVEDGQPFEMGPKEVKHMQKVAMSVHAP